MKLLFHALSGFLKTRSMAQGSRARFEKRQQAALSRWLKYAMPQVGAFRDASPELSALPVMDKAMLMADFSAYNRHGITAEQVREAMARDHRIGNLTVGASTGTSGNRGLFVISEAERYRWLGSILAKAIPDLLFQKQRVAIVLPQNTGLYDSANQVRQITLQFFDLAANGWERAVEAFKPTVLVAPPRVLRRLIEQGTDIAPIRVFSAAETLDLVDHSIIEKQFGPLDQIYMATEGLLGVTCRHGRLHLAEDSVYFEFEPVGDGLVSPLISSFRRETQILARYRLNDLLRLDLEPCPCGSPLTIAQEVLGRMDDCFHLEGPDGPDMVTPDILRNAIIDADARIEDYRLIQTAPARVVLVLPPHLPAQAGDAAKAAVHALLREKKLCADIELERRKLAFDPTRKLRRVECRIR